MGDIMISIFTPTFNRKEFIRRLADSLLLQNNKNFEWIIVDDGSTDNTKELIETYQNCLNIQYVYQNNSGKHAAYNQAILLCRGDLFVCVDSDDMLTPDAINVYEEVNNNSIICIGYLLPQNLSKSNDVNKWDKIQNQLLDILDLKFIHNITESNIAIKANILKKYEFPIYYDKNGQKEMFCPEDVLYNQLVQEGKFLIINKVVYISEYLEGGLTSCVFRLWINNSNGVLDALNMRYHIFAKYPKRLRLINRFRCIMNINALCMVKRESIKKHTPSFLMSCIFYVPSIIFRSIRYHKYE